MDEKSAVERSNASPQRVQTEEAGLGNPAPLIRGTVDELQRILDSQKVVGEPMTFGDTTVIPLVSLGFGFGAGGGGGRQGKSGDVGQGGGGGGAGGVKPVAVLIVDGDGVRLAPMPRPPSGLDKLGSALAGALKELSSRKDDDDD